MVVKAYEVARLRNGSPNSRKSDRRGLNGKRVPEGSEDGAGKGLKNDLFRPYPASEPRPYRTAANCSSHMGPELTKWKKPLTCEREVRGSGKRVKKRRSALRRGAKQVGGGGVKFGGQ